MLEQDQRWLRSLSTHGKHARMRWVHTQLRVMRLLGRGLLLAVGVAAVFANEADEAARAMGLLRVQAEPLPFGMGMHSCMQPEEPEPVKPPCPRQK